MARVPSSDRSQRGLIHLPCVEKHGVIWVSLTPGLEIDIDSWLGEWGEQLASLKLTLNSALAKVKVIP